jgi:hypothetical protein
MTRRVWTLGDAGPLGQRCDNGTDPYALDAFTGAAPDARPEYKLRDRRRPLALTLPPELIG